MGEFCSRNAFPLLEGWREGKKTCKRTLANLSNWPKHKIETLRKLLRDEVLVSPSDLFTAEQTLPHGHVEAVPGMIRKLGLGVMISSRRCRERDLVVAMIAERLLHACSKLATTRIWHTTTLAEESGVEDADEDDLYDAMDWLLSRRKQIEKKLAARHLTDGAVLLYDVSSSYYEGRKCPLARYGHDRDGKKGLPIIVYGIMADSEGRPVAVTVYPGNTGDSTTVADQTEKLREEFGLSRVVIVGDRGMLTQAQIVKLKEHPSLGWISALHNSSIRELVEKGALQLSLFDEKNLAEIISPDYPGERLIACYNPLLADERSRKRRELLAATEIALQKIARQVARRTKTPMKAGEIGFKVGKVLGRHKMGKHFRLTIEEGFFRWERLQEAIDREAMPDGIYVIRTSESTQRFTAEDTVRTYKSLSQVERAFRTMKGIDLMVRPIRHRTESRVPAHIFLCMPACYVKWHMRRALAPILFEDDELPALRKQRDPVAPAECSGTSQRKKRIRRTEDGFEVHGFETLMAVLASQCRSTFRMKEDPAGPSFIQVSERTPIQARAFELPDLFPVKGR
ncbi:MAG TPA: IS1634 family transposase [Acidobacteriota bacterium]|nr:IS1634 family transposase [Acidobacteriota bacterium]